MKIQTLHYDSLALKNPLHIQDAALVSGSARTDVGVMLMLTLDELMFLSVWSLQIRTTIRRCLVSWTTASWLPMPSACSSGEYACVSHRMALPPFAPGL